MTIDIDDIEKFNKHFVEPLIEKLDEKFQPLFKRVEDVETTVAKAADSAKVEALARDIDKLKANQAKALVGWTVLVMGVTACLTSIKAWLWSKLFK